MNPVSIALAMQTPGFIGRNAMLTLTRAIVRSILVQPLAARGQTRRASPQVVA